MVDHDFVYHATDALSRVNLAGSFNAWNKDSQPMKGSDGGRTWVLSLKLKPGRYTYKFVLNGEKWVTDPNAYRNEGDGNGNTNSLLVVTPEGYDVPAAKGDGNITASALEHLTAIPFLNYDRNRLILSLRTRPNDVSSIKVSLDGLGTYPMEDKGGDEFFETYSASVPWNRKADLRYRFVLDDGKGSMDFGPMGLTALDKENAFVLRAATFRPFVVPSWVEHSVIYQIFPDRFADGDKSNDPAGTFAWDAKPTYFSFFGGDIAGIEQHLGYLKGLGVSAIYFNPVFKGPSNHRYEASDYLQIDPVFGTNAQFAKLTRELKANGMRTILDGVFNHTSTSFPAFADVVKNGENSKFTHWYTFKSFPVNVTGAPNYEAWFGFGSMPKLNYSNPDVWNYMLTIPRFWQTHADVEGWRLDVPNEVLFDYWKDFRKVVKSTDPNAWIVGEIWGDGSAWLQGDRFDSVMNYQFRDAVVGFLGATGNGKPSMLMDRLMGVYHSYVPQVSRNLMNLIGSHDTARILTECGGDRSLAKLAAILEFTWVGTPSVYYGDELGMEGGKDPDNRRGMPWQQANSDNDFLRLYKKLIQTRNTNPALQSGDPVPVVADDKTQILCFARVLNDAVDLIAINRSNKEESVDLPLSNIAGIPKTSVTCEFADALSGQVFSPSAGSLHLRLSPRSAAVLIPRSGSLNHSRHVRRPRPDHAVAMSNAIVNQELP